MSLKFVSEGRIDNKSALVEVMAWCWTDHLYKINDIIYDFKRQQWVNSLGPSDAWRHQAITWTDVDLS